MKTCLSIAGSDCSGGAGVQADLKTFSAHGVYGMSVITALTAQNTKGVAALNVVDSLFVKQQLDAVFNDIEPDAIKIGMLANRAIIKTVSSTLISHKAGNVVLDPVMISSSGVSLLDCSAMQSLIANLIPCVRLITPNLSELVVLAQSLGIANVSIPLNQSALQSLTQRVYAELPRHNDGTQVSILSKGGHLEGDLASDILIDNQQLYCFSLPRIKTNNTHGTGCTLSSAIACQLALINSMRDACDLSKAYLQRTLSTGLNLGSGVGPLWHMV